MHDACSLQNKQLNIYLIIPARQTSCADIKRSAQSIRWAKSCENILNSIKVN